MIKTDDKTKCCGCKTCSIVCPKTCIYFSKDHLGALYPVINNARCVNCGRCETVCPMQRSFNDSIGFSAYAAFSIDKNVRFRGASGGIFETLATWIIENNGTVFASRFDKDLKLKGFEAFSLTEVQKLTKSKYLQSDLIYLFPVIQSRLLEGQYTLFCGTPCQTSALKNYLGIDAKNEHLVLIDFFCHGVPPQDLFDKCIRYVEKKKKINIINYEFRSKKDNGSTPHYYTLVYKKAGKIKEKTELYYKDPFYFGFQKYITLRDSCYHCPYGSGNHQSDITIGDFHDIDRYIQGINRFDGVSTVIVNTSKGDRIWQQIKDKLIIYDVGIKTLFDDGIIYAGGTKEPNQRKSFLHDLEVLPFDLIVKKWLSAKGEWKKGIYYSLPAAIRRAIRFVIEIK